MVNNITKAKKYQIFSELKEEKIRMTVQAKACVENATDNFQERKEMRLRNRIQNAQKIVDSPVRAEMQNRITVRMNNLSAAISELSDNASSVSGNSGADSKKAGGS